MGSLYLLIPVTCFTPPPTILPWWGKSNFGMRFLYSTKSVQFESQLKMFQIHKSLKILPLKDVWEQNYLRIYSSRVKCKSKEEKLVIKK